MQQCLFSWQIIQFIVKLNGLISSMDQTQACVALREATRRWKVMAFCGEVRGSTNLKERRLCLFGQYTSFFKSKAKWATFPHPQRINLVYLEPTQSSDLRKRTSSVLSEVKQTCLGGVRPVCVSHASCAENTDKPPSPSVTTGWIVLWSCAGKVFLCIWILDTWIPSLAFACLRTQFSLSMCSFFSWRQWYPPLLSETLVHTAAGEENGTMLCHCIGLNGDDEILDIHIERKSITSKSMCSKLQYWKCLSVLFWFIFPGF